MPTWLGPVRSVRVAFGLGLGLGFGLGPGLGLALGLGSGSGSGFGFGSVWGWSRLIESHIVLELGAASVPQADLYGHDVGGH